MCQRLMGIAVLAVCVLTASAGVSEAKTKSSEGTSSGNVTYKAAPEATLKYQDGVVVHRHSDGSVEVSDPDCVESSNPVSRPAKRAVKHRVAVKKAGKTKHK